MHKLSKNQDIVDTVQNESNNIKPSTGKPATVNIFTGGPRQETWYCLLLAAGVASA